MFAGSPAGHCALTFYYFILGNGIYQFAPINLESTARTANELESYFDQTIIVCFSKRRYVRKITTLCSFNGQSISQTLTGTSNWPCSRIYSNNCPKNTAGSCITTNSCGTSLQSARNLVTRAHRGNNYRLVDCSKYHKCESQYYSWSVSHSAAKAFIFLHIFPLESWYIPDVNKPPKKPYFITNVSELVSA